MRGSIGARRRWEQQPVRFLVVGAANTVLGYGVFVLLEVLLGDRLPYLVVLALTYATAGQLSFAAQRSITYRIRGRDHLWLDLGRYWSVNAGTVLLNALVLPVLVELLGLPPVPAQAVALLVVTCLSYLGHTHFSFRRPAAGLPHRPADPAASTSAD